MSGACVPGGVGVICFFNGVETRGEAREEDGPTLLFAAAGSRLAASSCVSV